MGTDVAEAEVDPRREPWRVAGAPLVVAVLAIGLAELVYALRAEPVIFDAGQYVAFARDIADHGLFGYRESFARFRTYGYPLFIRVVTSPWGPSGGTMLQSAVFHAQLGVLLLGGAVAGRVFGRVMASRRFGVAVFATIVLNPILLAHTVTLTSDLVSAVLCLVATVLALPSGAGAGLAVLAAFVAGSAVMVRPANLAVLAAVLVLLAARAFARDLRWSAVAAALVAALVPFVPQVIGNLRIDEGRFHPLLVEGLYGKQAFWGMQYLKYATARTPALSGAIPYANPFYAGFATPLQFFRARPLGYVATLALHAFAMLDHDLVFNFVLDPKPWYRWPATVLGATLVALAAGGAVHVVRNGGAWPRRRLAAFASLLVIAAAYVAVYVPTAVESRFGLAVDLLLTPLAVLGASRLLVLRRPRAALPLVALLVAVGAAAWLSGWVQRQAPMLDRLEAMNASTRPR